MRQNKIKQMWAAKKCVTLGWLSISHGLTAEVMARLGFDALCVDLQHGTSEMKDVAPMLQAMKAEGKTIFYCSHMMDVVEKVSDRIVLINDGGIIADGTIAELRQGGTDSLDQIRFYQRFDFLGDAGQATLAASLMLVSWPLAAIATFTPSSISVLRVGTQ